MIYKVKTLAWCAVPLPSGFLITSKPGRTRKNRLFKFCIEDTEARQEELTNFDNLRTCILEFCKCESEGFRRMAAGNPVLQLM